MNEGARRRTGWLIAVAALTGVVAGLAAWGLSGGASQTGAAPTSETQPSETQPGASSSDPAQPPSPTASDARETSGPQASASNGGGLAADVPTRIIDNGEHGSYGVVVLDLEQWDVRVDWPQHPDGTDLGAYIAAHPGIAVLTNAGIFSEDLSPGGLLVASGEQLSALNLRGGGGNFHLLPNAVFQVLDDGTAAVVESSTYTGGGVVHATQSGPALLLNGEIHPQFTQGSTNTALRSGVGVSPDGRTVYLAITRSYVNLWDFAQMFRDDLGVDNALYLDGQISQLWIGGAPEPTPYLGPYAGVIAAYPR